MFSCADQTRPDCFSPFLIVPFLPFAPFIFFAPFNILNAGEFLGFFNFLRFYYWVRHAKCTWSSSGIL